MIGLAELIGCPSLNQETLVLDAENGRSVKCVSESINENEKR